MRAWLREDLRRFVRDLPENAVIWLVVGLGFVAVRAWAGWSAEDPLVEATVWMIGFVVLVPLVWARWATPSIMVSAEGGRARRLGRILFTLAWTIAWAIIAGVVIAGIWLSVTGGE